MPCGSAGGWIARGVVDHAQKIAKRLRLAKRLTSPSNPSRQPASLVKHDRLTVSESKPVPFSTSSLRMANACVDFLHVARIESFFKGVTNNSRDIGIRHLPFDPCGKHMYCASGD